MRLQRLQVRDFGTIAAADVSFGVGLNVLFGPNDLGKSTLAGALRAVLLMQPQSSAAKAFVPWRTNRNPQATLTFEHGGRCWRVHKTWSTGSGRKATLSWSNDGHTFTVAEEGRAVDGELRKLLGWGIAEPGGRGGKHGLPRSFLSTVLLGEQAVPYRVFDQSLADDAEESGRARLTEALQAMAADPLFADVLGRTQARVDEAYTGTGKKKKGRGSPFKRVSDEISRREDVATTLAQRLGESEAVARRLAELDGERDRLMTARAEMADRLAAMQADLERIEARRGAAEELARAKQNLDELERNRDEIERLAVEELRRQTEIPEHDAKVAAAGQARAEASDALSRARQRLTDAREGGEAEVKARRQSIERERVELQGQVRELEHELERAKAAEVSREAALAAQTTAEAAAVVGQEAADALLAAERTLEALAQEDAADRAAVRWLERREAEEALHRLEAAAAEAETSRTQAVALRTEAATLTAEVDARGLPDAEALRELEQVVRTLEMARARLGGGLSIAVTRSRPGALQVAADGGALVVLCEGDEAAAHRELEIAFGEAATVRVVAGEAEAREAVRAAESAHETRVRPALAAAAVPDVAGLRDACEQARQQTDGARRRIDEAGSLERLAESRAPAAADLDHARRGLADAMERAADIDEDAAQARAASAQDASDLRARRQARVPELDAARAAVSLAKSNVAEARARHAAAVERADAATETAREAARALDGDPTAMLKEGAARADTLLARSREIEAALQTLDEGGASAVREAEAQLAAAQAAVDAAKTDEATARAELDAAKDALASARGKLAVRREHAAQIDALTVAETYARLQDALAALPQPTRDVSAQDVDAARDALAGADRALDEAQAEVRKQEGALQQVGGEVVREKAEAAREALEASRRRQAEVELEYQGWRMLLDTLREAENVEGHHLGRALGRQVGERFEQLTAGRYGTLELGPELEARGLRTQAAGVQKIDALSEGLKEQLATILRVSVAEQLEGALVLDDHLTQTDPARVSWFADLLRTAARNIQIVVLTCRPADYLSDAERPPDGESVFDDETVRCVALSRVIERIG